MLVEETMGIKLSDYIWDRIADEGVRHVFMLPGGGAMHLVDSLGRSKRLEYVPLLHEQSCSFAAETYARIADGIGAVCVTTGPGGTNAVSGCAAAWLESTPVVFVSGQVKTTDLKTVYGVRQKGNQEVGIVDIVSTITKYAVTVTDPDTIVFHIEKALHEAKEGRPGPVWLDIPQDVQAAIIHPDTQRGFSEGDGLIAISDLQKKQVKHVVELLAAAKRPVVIAGQGIERGGGHTAFSELVDYLQIPALTSWIATELLDANHICNMGKPGMVAPRYSNFAVQSADLVLVIGSRLDPSMMGYDQEGFAPCAKKVIVDIDRNELDKFGFSIEEKIEMDATLFIRELLSCAVGQSLKLDNSAWMERCNDWKTRFPLVDEYKQQISDDEQNGYVNPFLFFDTLFNELADDDIVIPTSSGAAIDLFWLIARRKANQRMLATGSLGSMGYGLPAAIGAHYASDKRVICVEGDGSIQLNIQELAVVAGRNIPIKLFVLDNGGYLSIKNMQKTHFEGRTVAATTESGLYLPDLIELAQAYGLQVLEVNPSVSLSESVGEVLSTPRPTLCIVRLEPSLSVFPKVVSRVLSDGGMASGKLEDLWPFLPDDTLACELAV